MVGGLRLGSWRHDKVQSGRAHPEATFLTVLTELATGFDG